MTHNNNFSYDSQSNWCFDCRKMQSPINIETDKVIQSTIYNTGELNYDNKVKHIIDTGHNIELATSGTAYFMNRMFSLVQVHFHAPSEHTVDKNYSAVEIHFVHFSEDGRIAVLGVFADVGEENEAFEIMLDKLIHKNYNEEFIFPIEKFLPEKIDYYHYLGSLTTPPLTENVEWYVVKDHIEISSEQLELYKSYYNDNNREIQELNDRKILFIEHA
ncbi:MAG: hypothetical protein ATN32_05040 [Candidatus Epulonipiscium fishelsonii]|nr:MAG: hypothetical protein ATN32_05040 [Epulopiscium sp. AS2M-Bin002]